MKQYKYLVGVDPYTEKKYNLLEKVLIYLGFKKREFISNTFEIVFDTNWLRVDDMLTQDFVEKKVSLKVLDKPKLNNWNKLKKFLGLNYQYTYNVKFKK